MISHDNQELFSSTYFENGLETGVSLYENYRWLPELTIPMACRLKEMYPNKTVLDFGCAKGYMVKALRIMGVKAWGFDISQYAIGKADPQIKKFVTTKFEKIPTVDLCFAKDTLEHVRKKNMPGVLAAIREKARFAFFIVPLGDGGTYRIKEYGRDLSHRIAEDENWWGKMFESEGFRVDMLRHDIIGFKDKWASMPTGNGYFFMS